MTYNEFKESKKDEKYKDGKTPCYICGSNKAYWEIGDSRYYCAGCEEHAGLWDKYIKYLDS